MLESGFKIVSKEKELIRAFYPNINTSDNGKKVERKGQEAYFMDKMVKSFHTKVNFLKIKCKEQEK